MWEGPTFILHDALIMKDPDIKYQAEIKLNVIKDSG